MQLSLITACYNHGKYLEEMLKSVNDYKWNIEVEHIIVNDGSTDELTLKKLREINDDKRAKVIHQENAGLAKARNVGISASVGKYILPLDSDNKLRPATIEHGIKILEERGDVDVVYTDAEYFGDKNGRWNVGEIDENLLFVHNQIDACALIRKAVFEELGYYDEMMPGMGNEDWELNLRFVIRKKKFHYLPLIGFDYRVVASSMSAQETRPKFDSIRQYLVRKYALEYHNKLTSLHDYKVYIDMVRNDEMNSPFRTFAKMLFYKFKGRS